MPLVGHPHDQKRPLRIISSSLWTCEGAEWTRPKRGPVWEGGSVGVRRHASLVNGSARTQPRWGWTHGGSVVIHVSLTPTPSPPLSHQHSAHQVTASLRLLPSSNGSRGIFRRLLELIPYRLDPPRSRGRTLKLAQASFPGHRRGALLPIPLPFILGVWDLGFRVEGLGSRV